MEHPVVQVVIILFLILLNGFFSMAELALVKARKGRLERRAREGSRGAESALDLLKDPAGLLAAVQVGITLMGILAGAFGGATLSDQLAVRLQALGMQPSTALAAALILVVVPITYLTLVIGELLPKRLALGHPEAIGSALAPAMHGLKVLTFPAVWLLRLSTESLARLFTGGRKSEPSVTTDEIRLILDQGVQEGILVRQERAMLREVLRLGNRPVSLWMTHRQDIVFLRADEETARAVDIILRTRHPEFPVFEGREDNILGILNAKDYLAGLVRGAKQRALKGQLLEPLFVPSNRSALEVLELIQQKRAHMALCVDEHGGVEGLVTLRDFLGVIAGEAAFDQREHERPAIRREDGSWLLSGVLSAEEARDRLGLPELPGGIQERFKTLAGFLLVLFGRIPVEGDIIEWAGWRFEIADMDGNRIDKVLATRKARA